MRNRLGRLLAGVLFSCTLVSHGVAEEQIAGASTMEIEVEHGYADNNGVKIHYAAAGTGPLVVMIHGFPDFWYSWRHQMNGLKDRYRVVAMDQRGYNLSDAPEGIEAYDMSQLVSDVAAVIRATGEESAIIVGHDWGGMVAWYFTFTMPQMVDKLIILNLPHPNGFVRNLVTNEKQLEGSDYARKFREGSPSDPDIFFGYPMSPQTLSGWVSDPAAKPFYEEAFARSDFDAMLAYYKQNYPDVWDPGYQPPPPAPNISVPTLMFHGLDDTALNSDGLNNTWDWIDADLTLVTVPGADHFVQQDAAELVTDTMRWWLEARRDD